MLVFPLGGLPGRHNPRLISASSQPYARAWNPATVGNALWHVHARLNTWGLPSQGQSASIPPQLASRLDLELPAQ